MKPIDIRKKYYHHDMGYSLHLTGDVGLFQNRHVNGKNSGRGHGRFLKSTRDIGDPPRQWPYMPAPSLQPYFFSFLCFLLFSFGVTHPQARYGHARKAKRKVVCFLAPPPYTEITRQPVQTDTSVIHKVTKIRLPIDGNFDIIWLSTVNP